MNLDLNCTFLRFRFLVFVSNPGFTLRTPTPQRSKRLFFNPPQGPRLRRSAPPSPPRVSRNTSGGARRTSGSCSAGLAGREEPRGVHAGPARTGTLPRRESTSAPSPPTPAAPGHLTHTPSTADPPTSTACRGLWPQTWPQTCRNAYPNLQPPLPAVALPIGELSVEGAGLEAVRGPTRLSRTPPPAGSGDRSSDWQAEPGGRGWRRDGGRKFWNGLGGLGSAAVFQ